MDAPTPATTISAPENQTSASNATNADIPLSQLFAQLLTSFQNTITDSNATLLAGIRKLDTAIDKLNSTIDANTQQQLENSTKWDTKFQQIEQHITTSKHHAVTLTVQSSFGDTFSSSQLLQPPDMDTTSASSLPITLDHQSSLHTTLDLKPILLAIHFPSQSTNHIQFMQPSTHCDVPTHYFQSTLPAPTTSSYTHKSLSTNSITPSMEGQSQHLHDHLHKDFKWDPGTWQHDYHKERVPSLHTSIAFSA
jgi:hypothetical protein